MNTGCTSVIQTRPQWSRPRWHQALITAMHTVLGCSWRLFRKNFLWCGVYWIRLCSSSWLCILPLRRSCGEFGLCGWIHMVPYYHVPLGPSQETWRHWGATLNRHTCKVASSGLWRPGPACGWSTIEQFQEHIQVVVEEEQQEEALRTSLGVSWLHCWLSVWGMCISACSKSGINHPIVQCALQPKYTVCSINRPTLPSPRFIKSSNRFPLTICSKLRSAFWVLICWLSGILNPCGL